MLSKSILLSGLLAARHVSALPGAPPGTSWVPVVPSVSCPIPDPDCICGKFDDNIDYYCGYVDGSWAGSSTKRSLQAGTGRPELDLERRDDMPATAADFGPYTGAPDDYIVVRRRDNNDLAKRQVTEIVQREKEPLITAIATIGISAVVNGVKRCVTNRLPAAVRQKYIQGITGVLPTAATISGTYFDVGAQWTIRWDYALAGNGEAAAAAGYSGAHVNLQISDAFNRQSYAFYFTPSAFVYGGNVATQGKTYFDDVVSVLTDAAGYTGEQTVGWIQQNNALAATKIAQRWEAAWNSYQQALNGGELKA